MPADMLPDRSLLPEKILRPRLREYLFREVTLYDEQHPNLNISEEQLEIWRRSAEVNFGCGSILFQKLMRKIRSKLRPHETRPDDESQDQESRADDISDSREV